MRKTISGVQLDGFAAGSAQAGETAQILTKGWATSESSMFYVFAEQIANLIFPKLETSKDQVDRYLVILHTDDTADVFVQDFPTVVRVRPNRDVKAGEAVFSTDLTDIEEVRFPEASIIPGDRLVYFERRGWRFGILFDLTRETGEDLFAKDAAQLQKRLILDDILQITLAALREAEGTDYDAFILTEGKTDWRHLQTAFAALGYAPTLWYETSDKDRGDVQLLDACKYLALKPHDKPVICVFDRDNEVITKELAKQTSPDGTYQSWGNNVFSLMLPVPAHRKEHKNISIEMYYPDEVLGRRTTDGKRLCFDNEVRTEVVAGKVTKVVMMPPDNALELTKKVVSTNLDRIEDASGQRIGLSKARFAELISIRTEPFDVVDFEAFRVITPVIERILGPNK
jgi:hypothetical protein